MSDMRLLPSRLCGSVTVPLSKSEAHRALVCAALADQADILPSGEPLSDDLLATRESLAAILSPAAPPALADCRESGSTLRFLIPLAAALGVPAVFTGRGRLPGRPLGVYLECLPEHGVRLESAGGLPLTVSGKLLPGRYPLPGNVSSQFITGLLLALPLLPGDSDIVLTSPLESAPYVELTLGVMRAFGVRAEETARGWHVPGGQSYRPAPGFRIGRDWSAAAFFLVAGAIGGRVELPGLDPVSLQGDRAAAELFPALGAALSQRDGILTAEPGELPEHGPEIDASQIPDLVPALAAAAALLPGRETTVFHAERLRLKESDRLVAMSEGLRAIGGDTRETADGLKIRGAARLRGGTADSKNDHRIAMALSMAALRAENETVVTGADCVRKSYPEFFNDYIRLGGKAYELG